MKKRELWKDSARTCVGLEGTWLVETVSELRMWTFPTVWVLHRQQMVEEELVLYGNIVRDMEEQSVKWKLNVFL